MSNGVQLVIHVGDLIVLLLTIILELFDSLQGITFVSRVMSLLLQEATAKQNLPWYGLYWGVNTLSQSPRDIFNAQTVSEILGTSDTGMLLLEELQQTHQGMSLEEILDEIIPFKE